LWHSDLRHIVTAFEANFSASLLCDPLHGAVVLFADQVHPFDAELVRHRQGIYHQGAANSSRTPSGFNGEGGLRHIAPGIVHGSQLGNSAHFIPIEVSEYGGIGQVDATYVVLKELVGDLVAESQSPTFATQPQQVIAKEGQFMLTQGSCRSNTTARGCGWAIVMPIVRTHWMLSRSFASVMREWEQWAVFVPVKTV